VDNSPFSQAEIDVDTELLRFWARAGEAGMEIALLAPFPMASMQVRKGKLAVLTRAIKDSCEITLHDGPVWSGDANAGFCGTGPGNWLAVWPGGAHGEISALKTTAMGLAAIADQSGAYRVFRISGKPVRGLLARGLPLNLAPATFAGDTVVVSAIARIGVILWQTDTAPTFMIAVAGSYCQSFGQWLSQAIAGVIMDGSPV
jgi:methylglutamate dehydrogenase subunit D